MIDSNQVNTIRRKLRHTRSRGYTVRTAHKKTQAVDTRFDAVGRAPIATGSNECGNSRLLEETVSKVGEGRQGQPPHAQTQQQWTSVNAASRRSDRRHNRQPRDRLSDPRPQRCIISSITRTCFFSQFNVFSGSTARRFQRIGRAGDVRGLGRTTHGQRPSPMITSSTGMRDRREAAKKTQIKQKKKSNESSTAR